MTIVLKEVKKAYVIGYNDSEIVGDTITATFKNAEDVSQYKGPNDQEFVVTRPFDAEPISDEVTIEGSDGGSVTGTITLS